MYFVILGDGSYGSVLKATNKATDGRSCCMYFCLFSLSLSFSGLLKTEYVHVVWRVCSYNRDSGYQKDEEEVLHVGGMCPAKRSEISQGSIPSKYCQTERGRFASARLLFFVAYVLPLLTHVSDVLSFFSPFLFVPVIAGHSREQRVVFCFRILEPKHLPVDEG